jgi:hypothetical protein
MMPLWAWVLLVVGAIGLLGALVICVMLYEFTWMKIRKIDSL